MSDLIDRQAAIDALHAWFKNGFDEDRWWNSTHVLAVIEGLPSAQPDVPDTNVGDMISRQAAIDIVTPHDDNRVMRDALEELPPAEPQIVRCKDCKHWIPYDWMFSEVWRSKNMADYPEDEIGCNYCDMAMKSNDFCSRGERREVTT